MAPAASLAFAFSLRTPRVTARTVVSWKAKAVRGGVVDWLGLMKGGVAVMVPPDCRMRNAPTPAASTTTMTIPTQSRVLRRRGPAAAALFGACGDRSGGGVMAPDSSPAAGGHIGGRGYRPDGGISTRAANL